MEKRWETGLMIDMARKYYSPQQLLRLGQNLAELGCNTFMLHFSEEMGVGLECPDYSWLAGRDGILCTQGVTGTVDPGNEVYTLEEMTKLVKKLQELGLEVIPSYDSPGHLNYTTMKFHQQVRQNGSFTFELEGDRYTTTYDGAYYHFAKNGIDLGYDEKTSGVYGISSFYTCRGEASRVKGTNNKEHSRGIDLCNEVAVAFVKSVFASYGRFFRGLGCTQIDIGGDEMLGFGPAVVDLNELTRWQQLDAWEAKAREISGLKTAVAYDMMVIYVNGMYELSKKLGYETVRIWNDEYRRTFDTGWTADPAEHVQFTKDLTVQYWSGRPEYESPVSLADAGYPVINLSSDYCYYVLTEGARAIPPTDYVRNNPSCVEAEWSPYRFGKAEGGVTREGWTLDTPERKEKLAGAMYCIWSDLPTLRTDEQVVDELLPMLKTWKAKTDRCRTEG